MAAPLLLAACSSGNLTSHPGMIGRWIDSRPPAVTVVEGGPSGALLGPVTSDIPNAAVDQVVAPGLREWLTLAEKHALAVASERAAVAPTGAAVDWQARDGEGQATADGSAVAIRDVYRSLRGRICRDVRQSIRKSDEIHIDTVALCRETDPVGVGLWVASAE